jgi:hypothetical protein
VGLFYGRERAAMATSVCLSGFCRRLTGSLANVRYGWIADVESASACSPGRAADAIGPQNAGHLDEREAFNRPTAGGINARTVRRSDQGNGEAWRRCP